MYTPCGLQCTKSVFLVLAIRCSSPTVDVDLLVHLKGAVVDHAGASREGEGAAMNHDAAVGAVHCGDEVVHGLGDERVYDDGGGGLARARHGWCVMTSDEPTNKSS